MGGPDGVLKQHKRSQGGHGVYRMLCQVRISDMFTFQAHSQSIAGTASVERPSADSQATFQKTLRQRQDSMGRYPQHPKTVGGCVCV